MIDDVREPKRANSMLFANEFFSDMLKGLRNGRSVTKYRLDPLKDDEAPAIEFEVRVTRYGKDRVPRVTQAMVSKAEQT